MAKEGVFGSAEKGWEVYVNGRFVGGYKWRSLADRAYREEKEVEARKAESAKQTTTTVPKTQPVAPAPAGPSRLSRVGSGFRKVGRGLKYAGGKIKGGYGKAKAAHSWATGEGTGEPNKLMGWLFFVLSLILYYLIDWRFSYNGIDFKFFIDMTNLDWVFKAGAFSFLLTLFVLQLVFKQFDKNALFLDIVAAIVFVAAQYSEGALFHFIFVLVMWFVLIKPMKEDISSAYKTLAILMLIDFVGISLIEKLFSLTGVMGETVAVSYMIFPIFSLYLLNYLQVYGKSRLAAIMLSIIIILYVFGFVRTTNQYDLLTEELELKEREENWGFWKKSITRFSESLSMLWDPIVCSSYIVNPAEHEECLMKRQIVRLCSDKIGTDQYDQCLDEKKGLDIGGKTDKTIKEYTKVEFKKPEDFPQQVQKDFVPAIPMQLNIESPKKAVSIKLSCKFKTTGTEIAGMAEPARIDSVKIGQNTILCSVPSGKELEEGKFYTVVYKAEIEGIETNSTLTRLFIGKDVLDDAEKNNLIKLHELSIKESSKSAEEFAVFSFGIGTPPSNPFINKYPTQVIIGNIENLANGKILSVDNIEVELIDGVTPAAGCLTAFSQSGNKLILKQDVKAKLTNLQLTKGSKRFLLGCNLNIASFLAETEDYVKRGFSSKITYSYAIEKEERFSVAKIPSLV